MGILNKSNRNNGFNRFCKSRNNIHSWIDLVVRFISFTETDESVTIIKGIILFPSRMRDGLLNRIKYFFIVNLTALVLGLSRFLRESISHCLQRGDLVYSAYVNER